MRKSSTLVLVLGAGLFASACSQDLSIPDSEIESSDGGSSGWTQTPKGGRGAGASAGSAAGGRFSVAGAAGSSHAGQGSAAHGGSSGSAGSADGGEPPHAGGMSNSTGGSVGGGASGSGGVSGAGGVSNSGGMSGSAGEQAGMGGAVGGGGAVETPELLFSEYVEGSGTYKALELFALSAGTLEGCFVELYFNGNLEASARLALQGVLDEGSVTTLCSSALAGELAMACDLTLNLNFNGDDAIAIVCENRVLDVIGQIGVDPGSAWGDEVTRTADRSLRRRCDVTTGDPNGFDPFDPALEWHAFPVDTFDGLGAASCEN